MRISDCSSDVCSSDLTVVAAKGVRPDQFTLAQVDGDELPFPQLKSAIADLEAAGRPVDALKGVLWHKISGPLSAILMPLLGAVAAFGLRSEEHTSELQSLMRISYAVFCLKKKKKKQQKTHTISQ